MPPVAPSATTAAVAAMPTIGRSSLAMVPAAVAVPSSAPTGADSTTLKVSASSIVLSAATLTVTVLLDSPDAKLTVPVVAPLKSSAVAVPSTSA